VFFNWPDGTILLTTHVGTTHKLDDDGNVEAAKTASSDGIKFYSPTIVGSLGSVRINHAVGNPLCTILGVNIAGPIFYAVVVNAFKDRSTWIQGQLKGSLPEGHDDRFAIQLSGKDRVGRIVRNQREVHDLPVALEEQRPSGLLEAPATPSGQPRMVSRVRDPTVGVLRRCAG
jgi:hypothetical protein